MTLKYFYIVNRIERCVYKLYGITIDELKARKHPRKTCIPRQICMYMMLNDTKLTQGEIGDRFGKHHATVINARRVINNLRETDKDFNRFINYLHFGIKNNLTVDFISLPESKKKYISQHITIKSRDKVEKFKIVKKSPFAKESNPVVSNEFKNGVYQNF